MLQYVISQALHILRVVALMVFSQVFEIGHGSVISANRLNFEFAC